MRGKVMIHTGNPLCEVEQNSKVPFPLFAHFFLVNEGTHKKKNR